MIDTINIGFLVCSRQKLKLTDPILLIALLFVFISNVSMTQIAGEFDISKSFLDSNQVVRSEGMSIFMPTEDAVESEVIRHRIEPTSPILGHRLVSFIKGHPGQPAQIIAEINEEYPRLDYEISVSTMAYLNVLRPGLLRYNDEVKTSTQPQSGQTWTEVEPAAIPLEVLLPMQPDYIELVGEAFRFHDSIGFNAAVDSTIQLATAYGNEKSSSEKVGTLLRPNNWFTKYTPSKVARLIQLNAVISSAEASYPRTQHSLNGYTQYVYDYLLRHNDLEGMLQTAYSAQTTWLNEAAGGSNDLPFVSFVERAILEAGYSHRDALITLCYSSRNMPNLDIQYARSSKLALMLEVYFWKFKELQNKAIAEHFHAVYPNHVFGENPMLYHFATASYLSYEITRSGFSNGTAIGMAFLSKAGYKLHKMLHAASWSELRNGGMGYVRELLEKQSSLSGIAAGYYGGLHGVSISKMEDRSRSMEAKDVKSLALDTRISNHRLN